VSDTAAAPWLTPEAITLATLLLRSHSQAFCRPLLALAEATPRQIAQELFAADLVLLAHDGGADPRFTYANRAALRLWRRPWREMVGLPSRLSAEPAERGSRAVALAQALAHDTVHNYAGIRVDSQGRRFRIEAARLWTLRDAAGAPCGQAAAFSRWWWL
jgi:hypothetical protein